jgi:phosphonate transport system substrate-binding protein
MSSLVRTLVLLCCMLAGPLAYAESYTFGVLNQRSATLTAQYWNPILKYVGDKAGIVLEMKMGKTAQETSAMTGRGEFDFLYSNHIFTPENSQAGYRVILRPNEDAIQGQIVVPEESPLRSLSDLQGKEVGFPSAAAFVGYAVPMDHLLRNGIEVKPVFAGNQEGIMAQLKSGKVMAAAVNSRIMHDYAIRTGMRYRVLWTSQDYLNLPVSVLPHVPGTLVEQVRRIMDEMDSNPEGLAILKVSAEIVKQSPPYGFRKATDRDYQNYRDFYRNMVKKDL